MPRALHGIFVPNLVPLDASGQINERELRRYLDWLIDRGVHGIYCNGSVGEFVRFNLEERRRIARIVCDHCRDRVPVLAGATEANTREVIDSCKLYRDYGARAVALLPPLYYRLSQDGMYAYFAEIAAGSPIDVTLYNIPLFATPIEVGMIARLARDFKNIIGMKDSSGDIAYLARLISTIRPTRPDFCFLSGWEAALVPQLVLGADGGTHATAGVLPELTRRMYDCAIAGIHGDADMLAEGVKLQLRLMEFFDAMVFGVDFPEGVRTGAELRGFDFGSSRQPLTDKQRTDRTKLQSLLQCIMSEFGIGVVQPVGGCSIREPRGSLSLEQDNKIQRVTEAVLDALKQRGIQ